MSKYPFLTTILIVTIILAIIIFVNVLRIVAIPALVFYVIYKLLTYIKND